MFCDRCRSSNPDNAQFCRNCASPLGAVNQRHQQNDQAAFIGHNPPAKTGASGRAITSMILSIASLLLCCMFLGVPGMILGKIEMNAIRDGHAPQAGDGFAKTGFYLGIAGTALSLIVGGLYILGGLLGTVSYY